MRVKTYQIPHRLFFAGAAAGEDLAVVAVASVAAFLLSFALFPPEDAPRAEPQANQGEQGKSEEGERP